MRRFVLVFTAVALVVAICSVGTSGAVPERTELCHDPGGPDEATLLVPPGAVAHHLAHGDLLGPCGEPPPPSPLPILDEVLARDPSHLRCGVSLGSVVGFSTFDGSTGWEGLDVDLCRAVAAAVLGDADAVVFVPLDWPERFPALRNGVVDVVFNITTDTLTRDATFDRGGHGVNFGPVYFYDGSAALAWPDPLGGCGDDCGLTDLDGWDVCVLDGTATREALVAHIERLGIDVGVTVHLTEAAMIADFLTFDMNDPELHCAAMAGGWSQLAEIKLSLDIPELVMFDHGFTRDPLAPAVRDGDDEWMAIVRWTVYATFLAEEMGVTKDNVTPAGIGAGPLGPHLGLELTWDYDIIRWVGNYAEIYERNLGPLGFERGHNALVLDGGLLYAPPFR